MAPEKTEAVILSGRKDRSGLKFKVNNIEVTPAKNIKYLRITICGNIRSKAHIKKVANKVENKLRALMSLMPNIGEPDDKKRQVLYGVVQYITLYGAPIWADIMSINKYKNNLEKVQTKALLRIASGDRTIYRKPYKLLQESPLGTYWSGSDMDQMPTSRPELHGSFKSYTKRIAKSDEFCTYCGEVETPFSIAKDGTPSEGEQELN